MARNRAPVPGVREGKGEPRHAQSPKSQWSLVRTEAQQPPSCPLLPRLPTPVPPVSCCWPCWLLADVCVSELTPTHLQGGGGVHLGGGPREPSMGTVLGTVQGSPGRGQPRGVQQAEGRQHTTSRLSLRHSDIRVRCLFSLFHTFPMLDSPVTGAHVCPSFPPAHTWVALRLLTWAMPPRVSDTRPQYFP